MSKNRIGSVSWFESVRVCPVCGSCMERRRPQAVFCGASCRVAAARLGFALGPYPSAKDLRALWKASERVKRASNRNILDA